MRPLVPRRAVPLCALILAAGALNPAAALAADPVALGQTTGTCPPNALNSGYTLPATAATHPSTVVSAEVSGKGWWETPDIFFTGPDVIWDGNYSVQAGVPQTGYFSCVSADDGFTYTVTVYDTPVAPTSYSGRTTPGGSFQGSSAFGSELHFIAPGAAPYVADITLLSGALRIGSREQSTVVASSKTVDLGALDAGEQQMSVSALDGPQAAWRIDLRPLPIEISGLKLTALKTQPGVINTISYTTSGDTHITAQIGSASGAIKATLADSLAVKRGDHTLTWDGSDANGNDLPDGSYSVLLTSTDPVGNIRATHATVLIDGTAPKVTFPRSRRLGPHQPIMIRVSDRGAGLSSALLKLHGRTVARRASGSSRIIYRPGRGRRWRPGTHRYTVVATDKVKNRATKPVSFRVRR